MSNTFASRRSANRRRRNEAREQILDAARRELKVKPFRELSVDELMQATGLSRTAFYRYFPDREAVLVDLLEEVWGALAEARDVETATEGIASASSMVGLTGLLSENRHVLKAIADAAPGDEDVEQAYRSFMYSYWIEDLTARIVDAQKHGLGGGLDPELAGEALGWMAERLVTQSLDREPDQVLDTIITIVAKCIYSSGGSVGGGSSGRGEATGAGGPGRAGDPVEPDPVEPDPIEADPIEADPVEPDPVEADPVYADPVEAGSSPAAEGPVEGGAATTEHPEAEAPNPEPPTVRRRATSRRRGTGDESGQD